MNDKEDIMDMDITHNEAIQLCNINGDSIDLLQPFVDVKLGMIEVNNEQFLTMNGRTMNAHYYGRDSDIMKEYRKWMAADPRDHIRLIRAYIVKAREAGLI